MVQDHRRWALSRVDLPRAALQVLSHRAGRDVGRGRRLYQRDAGAAARPAAWLSGPSLIDGANMYACDPALACDQFRMNYDALKMSVRHRDLSKQPNCAIAAVGT